LNLNSLLHTRKYAEILVRANTYLLCYSVDGGERSFVIFTTGRHQGPGPTWNSSLPWFDTHQGYYWNCL